MLRRLQRADWPSRASQDRAGRAVSEGCDAMVQCNTEARCSGERAPMLRGVLYFPLVLNITCWLPKVSCLLVMRRKDIGNPVFAPESENPERLGSFSKTTSCSLAASTSLVAFPLEQVNRNMLFPVATRLTEPGSLSK